MPKKHRRAFGFPQPRVVWDARFIPLPHGASTVAYLFRVLVTLGGSRACAVKQTGKAFEVLYGCGHENADYLYVGPARLWSSGMAQHNLMLMPLPKRRA